MQKRKIKGDNKMTIEEKRIKKLIKGIEKIQDQIGACGNDSIGKYGVYEFCQKILEKDDSLLHERVVIPQTRVFLSRLKSEKAWAVTTNPTADGANRACNEILLNFANKYVDRENCGVIYRMVRYEDVEAYGISQSDLEIDWLLNPDEFAV